MVWHSPGYAGATSVRRTPRTRPVPSFAAAWSYSERIGLVVTDGSPDPLVLLGDLDPLNNVVTFFVVAFDQRHQFVGHCLEQRLLRVGVEGPIQTPEVPLQQLLEAD